MGLDREWHYPHSLGINQPHHLYSSRTSFAFRACQGKLRDSSQLQSQNCGEQLPLVARPGKSSRRHTGRGDNADDQKQASASGKDSGP